MVLLESILSKNSTTRTRTATSPDIYNLDATRNKQLLAYIMVHISPWLELICGARCMITQILSVASSAEILLLLQLLPQHCCIVLLANQPPYQRTPPNTLVLCWQYYYCPSATETTNQLRSPTTEPSNGDIISIIVLVTLQYQLLVLLVVCYNIATAHYH